MRLFMMFCALTAVIAASDIARIYPPGSEPAKGGQDVDKPYPAGKELAHLGNQHLSYNHGDLSR